MVHKTWKPEEEKELVETIKKEGFSQITVHKLANRFDRSPEAIVKKLQRLGLNVVGSRQQLTTTFELPKDLPSLEEVMKIVAGALQKAQKPGLDKTELQRLNVIVSLSKEYRESLKEFVPYVQIEQKLVEMNKKYEQLVKEKIKNHASKRDSA